MTRPSVAGFQEANRGSDDNLFQQFCQSMQAGEPDVRDRHAAPAATRGSVEHPLRDFNEPIRRSARKAAAENSRPFGQRLMDLDELTRPGMPRVQIRKPRGYRGSTISEGDVGDDSVRRDRIRRPAADGVSSHISLFLGATGKRTSHLPRRVSLRSPVRCRRAPLSHVFFSASFKPVANPP